MIKDKEELDELFNRIIEAREKICKDFCKYTSKEYVGLLTQDSLDNICNYDCPLGKL